MLGSIVVSLLLCGSLFGPDHVQTPPEIVESPVDTLEEWVPDGEPDNPLGEEGKKGPEPPMLIASTLKVLDNKEDMLYDGSARCMNATL